jgi:hypothetical protein
MSKKSIGFYIIASALIWGAVIIACSLKLQGTTCYDDIKFILVGGVITHLLFIWGPLGILFRKIKEEKKV